MRAVARAGELADQRQVGDATGHEHPAMPIEVASDGVDGVEQPCRERAVAPLIEPGLSVERRAPRLHVGAHELTQALSVDSRDLGRALGRPW